MKRVKKIGIDERLLWSDCLCIHCGISLEKFKISKEHIPSKCLLMEPYPKELMTMNSCHKCNARSASDEQYLYALLSAVLAGSTSPEGQNTQKAVRTFKSSPRLRSMIEQSKTEIETLFGEIETSFFPDRKRVDHVVVKNARCHALYELDQALSWDPDQVAAVPLQHLTPEQRVGFETAGKGEISGWAEIGTRMFVREVEAAGGLHSDFCGSWIVVQGGVYRYSVEVHGDGICVRSVIREYLATETYWRLDD